MLLRTGKARGAPIGLRQIKKTNLSVCMASANMQGGTSQSTSAILRIRSEDTNSLTEISKMCTAAGFSRSEAELPTTSILTSTMQQRD